MAGEIKIRAGMDPFHFLPSDREGVFNVHRRICVMRKFDVIVIAVVFCGETHRQMPVEPLLLPVFVPLFLCAGADEELHFHLLEFAHAEDELPGYDLVPEGLPDLGNAEGDLHPGRLLDVQEINKDALCGFGTEIDLIGLFRY